MKALISRRLVLAGKKGSSIPAVFVQVCTPVETMSFAQSLRFESSVGAASKKAHNLLLAGAHLDASYAACLPEGYLLLGAVAYGHVWTVS